MAGSLAGKSLLRVADLRSLPQLPVIAEFLKPGIPLGFCIASAMTLVVSATNLAAGEGIGHLTAMMLKSGQGSCLSFPPLSAALQIRDSSTLQMWERQ